MLRQHIHKAVEAVVQHNREQLVCQSLSLVINQCMHNGKLTAAISLCFGVPVAHSDLLDLKINLSTITFKQSCTNMTQHKPRDPAC